MHRRDDGPFLAYATLPDASVREVFDGLPTVDEMRRQHAVNRPGDTLFVVVESSLEARLIGLVRIHWHRSAPQRASLQFVFDPALSHRGYCIEALQAILDHLFSIETIDYVNARCAGAHQTPTVLRGMMRLGLQMAEDGQSLVISRADWALTAAA